jgi:hypothetical protein
MTEPDDRGAPRRGSRSKEKKIPFSARITPKMSERLAHVANVNGRSVTQQHEILLDNALFRELDELAPAAPSASMNDLSNRLTELEAAVTRERVAVAGLRATVEKGLDHNAEVIARVEALLLRRIAEIEAKAATDTTALTTAIGHLQTATAHLLAALQMVDATLTDHRRAEDAPSRPRLVSPPDPTRG